MKKSDPRTSDILQLERFGPNSNRLKIVAPARIDARAMAPQKDTHHRGDSLIKRHSRSHWAAMRRLWAHQRINRNHEERGDFSKLEARRLAFYGQISIVQKGAVRFELEAWSQQAENLHRR